MARTISVRVWMVYLLIFLAMPEISVAQDTKEITNSAGIKLVLIPKGSFLMGSPPGESGRGPDELLHEVTISRNFFLGVTEVTQEQYQKVMGRNPSYFRGDKFPGGTANYPVEQVSWENAVSFCKRLSDLPEEKAAGRIYRLPTEAEWEYSGRAGSKATFSFGNDSGVLGVNVWFGNNSGDKTIDAMALLKPAASRRDIPDYVKSLLENGCRTHSVGMKKPNAWGLYDMNGNVWEWCSDWYDDYPKGAVTDPRGPNEGNSRVYRGGSWGSPDLFCRMAYRQYVPPRYRSYDLGFRIAADALGFK